MAAVDPGTLAVVDGDDAPHGWRPSRPVGPGRGRALGSRRAARRRHCVATPQLVGGRGVVLGRVAMRSRCEPDHTESAAREVGFILDQTGARVTVVPHDVPRNRLHRARPRRRVHRRDHRGARRRAPSPFGVGCSLRGARRRRSGRDPLDLGHDIGPERCGAHAPEPARRGRHHRAPRTTCARGEPLLLPMPITHVAGLTYGVLLPVTSGITAVLMDIWEPGRALELVEREHIAVMISTPVFMRTMIDHPAFACHRHLLGAAVLTRRRGRRARDGPRRRRRVRLLVQAHVRLDRVPDAHDRPARRRPRTRRDHRRHA